MGKRLVLGLILPLGVAAVAGLILATVFDRRGDESDARGTADTAGADGAGAAVLEGRRGAEVPEPAPVEPAVVLHDPVEEDQRLIGDPGLRRIVVKRLYERNVRDPRLAPALERVIREGTADYPPKLSMRYTIWQAAIVVMRTEGNRRYLRQLGRWGAAQQRESQDRVGRSQKREAGLFGWAASRFDPTTGRALYLLYWHALDESYPQSLRDVFFDAADLLAGDPKAGRARVAEALPNARGDELDAFLHAGAALGTVPMTFGPAFVRGFAGADTERRLRLLRRLWEESAVSDFAAEGAGKTVAEYLVRSWPDLDPKLHGFAVRVLGRLDAPTPFVLRHLMSMLSTRQALMAIEALGELGPGAASVGPALVEKLGEHGRYGPFVSVAVAKMGDPRMLPYLDTRLQAGDEEERRNIAVALAEWRDAGRLESVLLDEVRRGGWAALRTLVGFDLGAARPVTTEALVLSLRPSAPKVQTVHALRLTLELERVPDPVVDAMLPLLADEEAGRETVKAVKALGRFGADALRWKTRLLRVQANAEARGETPAFAAASSVLGEVAGRKADVRALLLDLLDRYAAQAQESKLDATGVATLQAILWALGGVEDPSREQLLTVARLHLFRTKGVAGLNDGYHLMGNVVRVLGKPSWHRVRMREGIGLSTRPRVREPTWGHPTPEPSPR